MAANTTPDESPRFALADISEAGVRSQVSGARRAIILNSNF
jgi:hypothetical protein